MYYNTNIFRKEGKGNWETIRLIVTIRLILDYYTIRLLE